MKLRRLDGWIAARRRLAARYDRALAGLPLTLPIERPPARHVYHLYTVRHSRRDALANRLHDLGVGTAVHYPIPVPEQPMFGMRDAPRPAAACAAREVLSLPCYAELTADEADAVTTAVRRACASL